MFILVILAWVVLIAAGLAVVGFSQIFKLGQGIRIVWAAVICIGLAVLLIGAVEDALKDAQVVSPTEEQKRDTFINEAIEGKPWMKREDFN